MALADRPLCSKRSPVFYQMALANGGGDVGGSRQLVGQEVSETHVHVQFVSLEWYTGFTPKQLATGDVRYNVTCKFTSKQPNC
jgi:hypothetical protein